MTSRNNIFRTLPKETYQKVLLNLNPKQLANECQIDIYATKICINYDLYFWNMYINKWYKYKHPNDYGYITWEEVINVVNPNNLIDFLRFLDKYDIHERVDIDIFITDIDFISNSKDKDIKFMKNNNVYQIKIKAFIDDTVGDLLDRILRLYNASPYKDNHIEYIKIICYGLGVIEYDIENDNIIFYVYNNGEIDEDETKELDSDIKLKDIKFYKPNGKNYFFSNLQTYNSVNIKIKNN